MSIEDRKAAEVYHYCLNDMNPDMKPARIAALADSATGELVNMCDGAMAGGYALKFPGDDRCMNIEVKIFRTLCEANGVNIDAMYEVLE